MREGNRTNRVLAIATVMAGLAGVTPPADAVDLEVNCDAGQSIQAAVDAGIADRILVAGFCGENVVIDGDDLDLTIEGNGATPGEVVVHGLELGAVFDVSAERSVIIRNLTVRGGHAATPGFGGGIRNAGTVLLDTVRVENNLAEIAGGGIWSSGPLTIVDSEIHGNGALSGEGGGIHQAGSTLAITASAVESNTAGGNGGGIWNAGTMTIENSAVELNEAPLGNGGGMLNQGTIVWEGGSLSYNQSAAGGGLWSAGVAELASVNIALNRADGDGGAVYAAAGADTTLLGNGIGNPAGAANSAGGRGGGIFNLGTMVMGDGNLVSSNTADQRGGGVYHEGSLAVADGSLIQGNSAGRGGGLFVGGAGSTVSITGSFVDSNWAGFGGGIEVASGDNPLTEGTRERNSVTVTGSSITRNTADESLDQAGLASPAAGGGLANADTVIVSNSTVSSNTVVGGPAAGIYNHGTPGAPASLLLSYSTITANGPGAGAVYNDDPTAAVRLEGTILFGNGGPGLECAGTMESLGSNLVGPTASPCDYAPHPTDAPEGSDPRLGPLTGPSGPLSPPTHHELRTGSDAAEGGGDCGLAEDQLGGTRPMGTACDIGAVESASLGPTDDVLLVEAGGRWHIRRTGSPDRTFWYGVAGDVPLLGDWDGDGLDTPGMYRPANGYAYLTNVLPGDGQVGVGDPEVTFYFGIPGDQVFVGDWDGDGDDSLGISRNGRIYLRNSNSTGIADLEFWFGNPGDTAFGGDPDGDGFDSVLLYRASSGYTYYTNATDREIAPTDGSLFFGVPTDRFVVGDWDGDGRDTVGVFRPANTTTYLRNDNTTGPGSESFAWGSSASVPVAGIWG